MLAEDERNSLGKQCATDAKETDGGGRTDLPPHATEMFVGLKGAIRSFATTPSFLFFFYSMNNTPLPPPLSETGAIYVYSFLPLRLSVDTNIPPFPCPCTINMPELCRNQYVSRVLLHDASVTDRQSLLTLPLSSPHHHPIPRRGCGPGIGRCGCILLGRA